MLLHLAASLIFYLIIIEETSGHGMVLIPPNRSSVWRFNKSAPINYNDNQNFCGGAGVQWGEFNGKCGICGDKYNDPHPQNNENGGKYGRGIVVGRYAAGSVINVHVLLTANHKGFFTYSLCTLRNFTAPEPDELCFKPLELVDGASKYYVLNTDKIIRNQLKLPANLKCKRCVLRWHYTAGNNWGICGNGTSGLGCGPQETFRTCSDIEIL